MNIESSTLMLRTINATNNANITRSTWRVNLRSCLGNLYNKYDKFFFCYSVMKPISLSCIFNEIYLMSYFLIK